jgi:hypothetical protein
MDTEIDAEIDEIPLVKEWRGIALDDGSHQNVYYLNFNDGSRKRAIPSNYTPEYFENGERKYYYKGKCLTCPIRLFTPVYITNREQSIGFSFNICEDCICKNTPNIEKIKNNGDIIYNVCLLKNKIPLTSFIKLNDCFYDPNREKEISLRAIKAKFLVQLQCKKRRDKERLTFAKRKALDCGIKFGTYISWGLEKEVFDEYFGEVDESFIPHGEGVKFFSDGTMYVGGFAHGEFHSDIRGFWSRTDGSSYDGTWMHGLKHGKGIQIYPDGTSYSGEFAKGSEHGHGIKTYIDGSTFEGRFRFGRRDGPGVLTPKVGHPERGNFRDRGAPYTDKQPPVLSEKEEVLSEDLKNPPSLLKMATSALANTMLKRRFILPSNLVFNKLGEHLKVPTGIAFMQAIAAQGTNDSPYGSKEFMDIAQKYSFLFLPEIYVSNVKMTAIDTDAFAYIQGGNTSLESLKLTSNKFKSDSIDIICKQLVTSTWTNIKYLDLSYNLFDIKSVQTFFQSVTNCPNLLSIKLQGCNLRANGAFIVSTYLERNKTLKSLDLSFNTIEALGADTVANVLYKNDSLTSLNLRHNKIGSIGGLSFVNLLKVNKTLKMLNIADNSVSAEYIAIIAGRIQGSMSDIALSTCSRELNMPSIYNFGRFERYSPEKSAGRKKNNAESTETTTSINYDTK